MYKILLVRNTVLTTIAAILITVLFTSAAHCDNQVPKQPVNSAKFDSNPKPEDLFIVELSTGTDREKFDSFLEEVHGKILRTITMGPSVSFLIIQAESGQSSQLEKKLRSNKDIASIERNAKFTVNGGAPPSLPSNDPLYSRQWGLAAMNYPQWREIMTQRSSSNVGIPMYFFDTGIDQDDYRFNSEMVPYGAQFDFSGSNPTGAQESFWDADTGEFHGTGTASVTCTTDNYWGLAGNANCESNNIYVIECRMVTPGGPGSTNTINIVSALSAIYNNNWPVGPINCSFGTAPPNTLNTIKSVQKAAQALYTRGFQFVVSAGNTLVADNSPELPYIRRVAALDQSLKLASFSTYGAFQSAAPGVNIPLYNPWAYTTGTSGTTPGFSGETLGSGTSFSAPAWCAAIADIMRLLPVSQRTANLADAIVHMTAKTNASGYWLYPDLQAAAQYAINHY